MSAAEEICVLAVEARLEAVKALVAAKEAAYRAFYLTASARMQARIGEALNALDQAERLLDEGEDSPS
jgi:hypothetical protein